MASNDGILSELRNISARINDIMRRIDVLEERTAREMRQQISSLHAESGMPRPLQGAVPTQGATPNAKNMRY